MNVRHFLKAAALVLPISPLAACAGSISAADSGPTIETAPPDVLYKDANTQLDKGNYTKSAEKFEEVDRQHPYSKEARESDSDGRRRLSEGRQGARGRRGRPPLSDDPSGHQGSCPRPAHYRLAPTMSASTMPTRDQADTKKALVELETLVNRYPDSRYAEDAKKRMRLARDVLAASEMNVGRWYQKKANYLAAINRFKVVVTDYQNDRPCRGSPGAPDRMLLHPRHRQRSADRCRGARPQLPRQQVVQGQLLAARLQGAGAA